MRSLDLIPPPRLRMFAGPNGSGKSTIKAKIESINKDWLGVNVNPDEIEAEIRRSGFIDFGNYEVYSDSAKLSEFLKQSILLKNSNLLEKAAKLTLGKNRVSFEKVTINAYFASVLSDFIRQNLLISRKSFSFETVMSSPDKIEFLQLARGKGYRNYLYFIATDDPVINASRVEHRVKTGGHDVPLGKINSRYFRSLTLLLDAIKLSDRAYVFDNSGSQAILVAEINDSEIEIKSDLVPTWFQKYVLDKNKGK